MTFENIRPAVGGSLTSGKAYHDIPGVDGPSFRGGSQARADQIAEHIDVWGKAGLDLGCSVGGVSIGLYNHGARMYGVDHDETAIAVASRVAPLNTKFTVADLADPSEWETTTIGPYDFAIWLANWMWLAKAAGENVARTRLHDLSTKIPTLAFETAQSGGSMAGTFGIETDNDVLNLLHDCTTYTDIQCVGPVADGWHGRSLFIARR